MRGRFRLFAWCCYDWAYSAFNTVITTFVFATYFVQAVAEDPARGTSLWGLTQGLAGLAIALLAAPIGAIADQGGGRRALFRVLTVLMVAATGALCTVHPTRADISCALLLVGVATVAYELATTFYNAMLPDITPPERFGRVSGIAWGAGYIGGLCCLALCLALLIQPDPPLFGLDRATAQNVRAAPLLAAVWMGVFSVPLLVLAPVGRACATGRSRAVRQGLTRLAASVRLAWHMPDLRRFLVARMLYADGLTTLFAFGAIYAAGRFSMSQTRVLQLGIGMTATAGIGALVFATLEDRIGARVTILACLACLIGLGVAVLLATDVTWFWATALPLGLFLGPAQSASRSLMARLAPAAERNAMFGLYALSGRATGFVGPTLLAAITATFDSQRAGMSVVLALLGAGFVMMLSPFRGGQG